MKAYLIQFTYEHYCQGYEDATISILVYAENYYIACTKIRNAYRKAKDFVNLTLE